VTTRAERELHREMVEGAETLNREIGYHPTRFNQMVAEDGGPEAARNLLTGRDASGGFTTLWARRLDPRRRFVLATPNGAYTRFAWSDVCSSLGRRPAGSRLRSAGRLRSRTERRQHRAVTAPGTGDR